jgi:hypothetical protein
VQQQWQQTMQPAPQTNVPNASRTVSVKTIRLITIIVVVIALAIGFLFSLNALNSKKSGETDRTSKATASDTINDEFKTMVDSYNHRLSTEPYNPNDNSLFTQFCEDTFLTDEIQKKIIEANGNGSKELEIIGEALRENGIDPDYCREKGTMTTAGVVHSSLKSYQTQISNYAKDNDLTVPSPETSGSSSSLTPSEQAWSAGYEDGYNGVPPDRNITKYVNYADYYTKGWEYGYTDSLMGNGNQNLF